MGLKKLKLRFSGLSARMMEVLALRRKIIVFFHVLKGVAAPTPRGRLGLYPKIRMIGLRALGCGLGLKSKLRIDNVW